MRALVAGWFSFVQMGATAGDLLARDVVCQWLTSAGVDFDIAVAPPFDNGIAWQEADPAEFTHLVFVCGPFRNAEPVAALLERFSDAKRVGINLSMLDPLTESGPFDLLWERDSDRASRPDLVFLSQPNRVPVVGLVLVDPQREYGDRARHSEVDAALRELTESRDMAIVPIDTRLDGNRTGLRTAHEVESLIARMDVVMTTRLHGMVFALKHGVPAIVVDAIAGGGKVYPQAKAIGWPARLKAGEFAQEDLERALDYCLTPGARAKAAACAEVARSKLESVRQDFASRIKA